MTSPLEPDAGAAPATAPTPPTSQPTTPAVRPEHPARSGPRTGTVLWGVIVLGLGLLVVATAAGYAIDLQLAAIVGLVVAGVALLLAAVVGAARGRR
ncbi:hypothetical protein [Miniimonas sp. S16]|uniref:hypothetical protein n=1 Tax=Miniimonas sp. S16 TaxID=2171623 RepID=UPI000D529869|nr:hypothetical protein [Miniimonas sp. S16]